MSVRLKILLSYHYYKDVDLDDLLERKFAPHYPEVFIDSGGFSAMTQGVQIDINAYANYIKRYGRRITTYANLDVIGDAKQTLANQKTLEAMGLQPIPVFHTGEDFRYLEAYVERYPYIALGGMVPYMRRWKEIMPWIVRCFKIAKGKSVFHGFGCTTWNITSRVAWYSVDSSSWAASFRFGQVNLFDATTGKWTDFALGDRKSCAAAARLIRAYGFDPEDFADRARNDRKKIAAIAAMAYMEAEKFLQKRHGPVVLKGKPDGIRLSLATGGDPGIDLANASAVLNEKPVGVRVCQEDANPDRFEEASVGMRLCLANRDPDHFARAQQAINEGTDEGRSI